MLISRTRVISYRGNPYSDFWVDEGDQRTMAEQLTAILRKKVEPRKKTSVPDVGEMAKAMKVVYESILVKDIVTTKSRRKAKKK